MVIGLWRAEDKHDLQVCRGQDFSLRRQEQIAGGSLYFQILIHWVWDALEVARNTCKMLMAFRTEDSSEEKTWRITRIQVSQMGLFGRPPRLGREELLKTTALGLQTSCTWGSLRHSLRGKWKIGRGPRNWGREKFTHSAARCCPRAE